MVATEAVGLQPAVSRAATVTPESAADRHAGTLDGRLTELDPSKAVRVAVVIPHHLAGTAIAQHTAWMTVNLLARAEKIVKAVQISCRKDATVVDNIIPFGHATHLRDRLVEAGSSIDIVPVVAATDNADADHQIVVGDLCHDDVELAGTATYTSATSWWGGVRSEPLCVCAHVSSTTTDLPFGAYAAACLAVARVFLTVRLPAGPSNPSGYGWDMLNQMSAPAPQGQEPTVDVVLDERTVLAGAGAVGCSFLHTLWATPGVAGRVRVADSDKKGVTLTNLNRGVLFRRSDIDKQKAAVAETVAARDGFAVVPFTGDAALAAREAQLLVSAVDTNRSRAALQQLYRAQILSASTRDLRAEVLRAGPPGFGACLRCYNLPEPDVGDDDLRRRALDPEHGFEILEAIANSNDLSVDDARVILSRGTCDEVSERALALLRQFFGAE